MRKTDPVYDFIRYLELNELAVRDRNGRIPDKEFYGLYIKFHDNIREIEDEKLEKGNLQKG
jgi:hypothetical protein